MINVGKEDIFASIAAKHNVIDGSWEMDSKFTCHSRRLLENVRKSGLTPLSPYRDPD